MNTILEVTLIDEKGNERPLKWKKNSHCLFMEPFGHGDYEIHLRLDLKDMMNGDPVLDADIKDKKTGKMIKKESPWHHTQKKYNPKLNKELYTFKFTDLQLRFSSITTRATDVVITLLVGPPKDSNAQG